MTHPCYNAEMKKFGLMFIQLNFVLSFSVGCAAAAPQSEEKTTVAESSEKEGSLEKPVEEKGSKEIQKEEKVPAKIVQKQQKAIGKIKEVLKKYRKSRGVTMDLTKKVYLALMDSEKQIKGKAFLSKGKFRLEQSEPEKSLMVMSPEVLWIENSFNGDIQISKVAMNGRARKKGLIGIFFDKTNIWDGYQIVKAKTRDEQKEYVLKPLKTNKEPEAQKVLVIIDMNKKQLQELTYWDELENKTTFSFENVKFGVALESNKFKYTPPKGAQVTEY